MRIDDVLAALKSQIILVRFTKADGTEKAMYATTQIEFIPSYTIEAETNRYNEALNYGLIRVIDTDTGTWKSLKFDSITEFDGVAI